MEQKTLKPDAAPEITRLLVEWGGGNRAALDELLPAVHGELQKLARSYMRRENSAHTLQTAALVNEAYLKLIDQKRVEWQSRAHFFGIAAQMMRRILVDHARSHQYAKRGGKSIKISLDDAAEISDEKAGEMLALDEALREFAKIDARRARVVELRYFGGLSNEEISTVLEISVNTVMRDWNLARAWLHKTLTQ
ncbi:MAG: sigma-70 family RNA polymerase sigma factor [Pyrinomonadaceae bacterium]